MKQTARFYHFYHSITLEIIRFFIILCLLAWIVMLSLKGILPGIPLFFLSWILMFETFFHFSLSRILPKKTVAQDGDIYGSFTLQAMQLLLVKNTEQLIKNLFKYPNVAFLLHKTGIQQTEIKLEKIDLETLAKKAYDVAKATGGLYVTTTDIFAAYLIMSEPQTKLLFSKKLKEKDVVHIIQWTNLVYDKEEKPHKFRATFWGDGIGGGILSGWTIETAKYTIDLTSAVAKQGMLTLSREKEYQQMSSVLGSNNKKSLLLVGDVGVGKEALVYSFGYESFMGNGMVHKRLYQLLVDRLLAGSSNQGELEDRLTAIIDEVSHAENVLLYIPNFENIVGASTFGINISGTLLPYLENGKLQLIGTATSGNYKTYIQPLKNISEDLVPIIISEPAADKVMPMLLAQVPNIESQNKLFISYKAVVKAAEIAKKYKPDSVLPGAAVTLLQDSANRISQSAKSSKSDIDVLEKDIEATVEAATGIPVSIPQGKEKETLLNLESVLHKEVVAQDEAIKVISQALRRVRSNIVNQARPISFLFLGPTGVGKTETAKTLANVYFKGEHNMLRFDMSEYTTDDGVRRLLGAAPGEGSERGELTDKIHDHPFSLVLLDEFEKADKRILDLFLQVFDDGRLTDNKGQTVSFNNCIIIATSNAGSELVRESVEKNVPIDNNFQQKLLDYLQKNALFKPELLNRFDAVVVFKSLTTNDMKEVAKHMLSEVVDSMQEKDITVTFDDKLLAKIVKEGINKQFGARPLRRYIQDNVEDLLAKELLTDKVKRGSKVLVSTDTANQITAVVS